MFVVVQFAASIDNHRHEAEGLVLFELPQDIKPAHVRQIKIQDNAIECLCCERIQHRPPISNVGDFNLHIFNLRIRDQVHQRLAMGVVVFDDQHPFDRAARGLFNPIGRGGDVRFQTG